MTTPPPTPVKSKRVLAGLMGILLGGLGIHRFVLGDFTGGLIRIAILVVTVNFDGLIGYIGSLIGFIEGIIYITKTDADFIQTYQVGKKGWF